MLHPVYFISSLTRNKISWTSRHSDVTCDMCAVMMQTIALVPGESCQSMISSDSLDLHTTYINGSLYIGPCTHLFPKRSKQCCLELLLIIFVFYFMIRNSDYKLLIVCSCSFQNMRFPFFVPCLVWFPLAADPWMKTQSPQ